LLITKLQKPIKPHKLQKATREGKKKTRNKKDMINKDRIKSLYNNPHLSLPIMKIQAVWKK
jgi:hypothetical protein